MMLEETFSQPLPEDGSNEPHESVITLSQPVTNRDVESKKRKLHERSASQPLRKKGKDSATNKTDRDLLLKIVDMLSNLNNRVDTIETSVTEFKNFYVEKDLDIDNQLKIPQILEELQSIKASIKAGNEPEIGIGNTNTVDEMGADPTASNQMDTTNPPAVSINPVDVIPEWDNYVMNRKNGFRKFVTNAGRYDLYNEWLARTPPFIPAEFLPKELRAEESERVYQVRKNQKRAELDSQMELLAVRRDEGLSAYQSVDTFIDECINDLVVSNEAKISLRDVYKKQINEGETVINNQWLKQKKGLDEKPQRETANKIVVSNERVYAKSLKKDKPKNKNKPKPTAKDPPEAKEAQKEENVPKQTSNWTKVDNGNKNKGSGKRENKNHPKNNNVNRKSYVGQMHHPFNPWFPYGYHVSSVPPPPPGMMPPPHLSNSQNIQPTVDKQPDQSYFHWGTPTNRWKNLSPNMPI